MVMHTFHYDFFNKPNERLMIKHLPFKTKEKVEKNAKWIRASAIAYQAEKVVWTFHSLSIDFVSINATKEKKWSRDRVQKWQNVLHETAPQSYMEKR